MARVFNYKTNPDYVEYVKSKETKTYLAVPKTSKSTFIDVVKTSDLYRHMVNQNGSVADISFYVEEIVGSPKNFDVKCSMADIDGGSQSITYNIKQGYNNFTDKFTITQKDLEYLLIM